MLPRFRKAFRMKSHVSLHRPERKALRFDF